MSPSKEVVISKTVAKESNRLFNFIRKRVKSTLDAEDILQDVFYQLVETYRLMKPVEQASAWLFRVARNKITDFFRKKKTERIPKVNSADGGDSLNLIATK